MFFCCNARKGKDDSRNQEMPNTLKKKAADYDRRKEEKNVERDANKKLPPIELATITV